MRYALGGVLIGAAVALALASPAGAAEVYKWTDASGTVHYADAPPEGVKYERMKVGGGTTTAAPTPAPVAAPSPPKAGTPEANADAIAKYNAARAQNCKIARDNLAQFEKFQNVQKDSNGDGVPEPMSPEQRAEEIQRNQDLVIRSCTE